MGRVITPGARWFFGVTVLALGAALAYGWGSRGGLNGVITIGLMGGVGEHTGMVVLLSLAVATILLGAVVTAWRDADPDAVTAAARTEALPEATAPAGLSYWPAFGAIAVGIALVGLVVGSLLFVVGLFLVGIVVVEWAVQSWADRATGDPETNRQIRNRFMYPIEFPVAGALGIAVLVLAVSRVFLALPKEASTVVAIVFAVLVLTAATIYALRPKLARALVVPLAALLGLAVIVGGIVAAAEGSRTFEEHETEEHQEDSAP